MTPALAFGFDPLGSVLHLAVGALVHFADSGHAAISGLLDTYLYETVDATSPSHGPLTQDASLAHLNLGAAIVADSLIVGALVVMFLRHMFEHSIQAKYSFRVIVPRLVATIVLVHFSLPLMQGLIDLNNGLGQAALHLDSIGGAPVNPWDIALGHGQLLAVQAGQDIFLAVFVCALVIALVILAMGAVIRYALLSVLIVAAPIAALLGVLEETRGHARSWARLFTATLFMQAAQLLVLRVAESIAFAGHDVLPQTIYSLATLWIMLKVPGAMSTVEHLTTKARTLAHGYEKDAHKLIAPPKRASRSAAS